MVEPVDGADGAAAAVCRPDLARSTVLGAVIFMIYYLLFLVAIVRTSPGYVERVWNLDALSGWTVLGLPVEELLFAAGFGAYWAGVYEHFTWHRSRALSTAADGAAGAALPS